MVDASDPAEDEVEPKIRRNGARVVIRSMKGRFLGALQAGFDCAQLLELLTQARTATTIPPQPSPIRIFLRQNPEAIASIAQTDGMGKAERYVELFREFDGDSEAVRRAEAELARVPR